VRSPEPIGYIRIALLDRGSYDVLARLKVDPDRNLACDVHRRDVERIANAAPERV